MESCIKELLSFTTEVRGIKFYPGYEDFRNADARGGFLHVDLRREADNTHDKNAVLIVTRCRTPRILGHLERRVTAAVARIIDLKLPYTRLKRLLLLDNYILYITNFTVFTVTVLAYMGMNIPPLKGKATEIVQLISLLLWKDHGSCVLTSAVY